MIGITFDYDIVLEDREYEVGETITHDAKQYKVRQIGKSFVVHLIPKGNEM